MKAHDVMVSPVITVKPSFSVREVAKTFLGRRISAAPVVDDQGKLVGIVSEGDLMHRAEAGTERHRSWWLQARPSEGAGVGTHLAAERHSERRRRRPLGYDEVGRREEGNSGGRRIHSGRFRRQRQSDHASEGNLDMTADRAAL